MQITPWSPFGEDPFNNFEKDLPANMIHAPSLNMYQNKNNLLVDIAMPGIDPKNVSIEIDDSNVMTIKGSSKKQTEVDDKNYYRKEIRTGTFFRRIPLPHTVVGEKATAEYEDGVLTITVPMATQKKAKTIKVQKKKKLSSGE